MPQPQRTVSLHRFHNYVAFCTEDTHTLYLTADTAARFAGKLLEYADDIKRRCFSKSQLGTEHITDAG